MNTESALDEFTTQDPSELGAGLGGEAEERRQGEFSEQVQKYVENRPRRNRKTADREWGSFVVTSRSPWDVASAFGGVWIRGNLHL